MAKIGAPYGNHNHTKHGKRNTRIYNIWRSMRQRCSNPNTNRYSCYGGRGIKVCEEWENFSNFYEWAMRNGYEDDLTIDRIDVNGNYEPSNCKWATQKEQQRNRRNTLHITAMGITLTVAEWGEKLNTCSANIRAHYKRGNIEKYIYKRMNSI